MRILVLQLARFGDIYQSWPTLKALQRTRPSAELHVLVRERFQEALSGVRGVHAHSLTTAKILEPIFTDDGTQEVRGEVEAHARLQRALQPLIDLQFDMIVNLSFSPFSSYLTDCLATSATEVRGYTRHADGPLHIPDDSSAYFYAQAGIERDNRYHVTDLFAAVAGVDLTDDDRTIGAVNERRNEVIVHLGASQGDKRYPAESWVEVLRGLSATQDCILVGSHGERPLADAVASQVNSPRVRNRVGESSLPELLQWIAQARLLIGADSAPVHMAALTQTPVLNLSTANVRFWETGPRSLGSRVLIDPKPQRVVDEAAAMLNGRPAHGPCAVCESHFGLYRLVDLQENDFSWRLIEALYTGTDYPPAETREDVLAFQRLFELAELALQQLERWSSEKARATGAKILAHIDELLPEIGKLNPRIGPVIRWFETERLRIAPGSDGDILAQTKRCFSDLALISSVYREFADVAVELRKAVGLCQTCAAELREYNVAAVESALQSLLSTVHELSRHSTKVGGENSWSSVLNEFNRGLESRDFIAVADFLEWKLRPALNAQLTERETLPPEVLS